MSAQSTNIVQKVKKKYLLSVLHTVKKFCGTRGKFRKGKKKKSNKTPNQPAFSVNTEFECITNKLKRTVTIDNQFSWLPPDNYQHDSLVNSGKNRVLQHVFGIRNRKIESTK